MIDWSRRKERPRRRGSGRFGRKERERIRRNNYHSFGYAIWIWKMSILREKRKREGESCTEIGLGLIRSRGLFHKYLLFTPLPLLSLKKERTREGLFFPLKMIFFHFPLSLSGYFFPIRSSFSASSGTDFPYLIIYSPEVSYQLSFFSSKKESRTEER
jgi:hypothetical protein